MFNTNWKKGETTCSASYALPCNCNQLSKTSVPFIWQRRPISSSHRWCSIKKPFLKISQNSQENTCARVSFLIKFQALACNFVKKETLAHVFFCEFCEILMNAFFTDYLPANACIFWVPLSIFKGNFLCMSKFMSNWTNSTHFHCTFIVAGAWFYFMNRS